MPNRSSFSSSRRLVFLSSLLAGVVFSCSPAQSPEPERGPQGTRTYPDANGRLHWAGFPWQVKEDSQVGPGPNDWKLNNVWVDDREWLHLRISSSGAGWACAELWTTVPLGFGTYEWQVDGPVDNLDRNVVLGLFPYGPPDLGNDGTNEIDIEFARWGDPAAPAGNWTVYPSTGTVIGQKKFSFDLAGGTATTNWFTWTASQVTYGLSPGFQASGSSDPPLVSWTYAPTLAANQVGQRAMPLHINLWLFHGMAPSDGKPVEIIIRSFRKTPNT